MTFENTVPQLVFSHGGAGCCRVLEHKLDEEDVQREGSQLIMLVPEQREEGYCVGSRQPHTG